MHEAMSTIFKAAKVNSKLWELALNLRDHSECSYGQHAV